MLESASGQNAVVEPCPRHVTDEELRTLHTCLMRWKREVKEDQQGAMLTVSVRSDVSFNCCLCLSVGLQEDIEEVTTQINEMYNESNLMQVRKLISVGVMTAHVSALSSICDVRFPISFMLSLSMKERQQGVTTGLISILQVHSNG